MGQKVLRFFCFGGGLFFGYSVGRWYSFSLALTPEELRFPNLLGLTSVGGMLGYLIAPWLYRHLQELNQWLDELVRGFSFQAVLGGAVGASLALLIANLTILPVMIVLGADPSKAPFISVAFFGNLLAAYLGTVIGVKIQSLKSRSGAVTQAVPKVLDTSVLIDGRIKDILRTNFLEGELLIPGFVVQELRFIADSQEPLRRARGRRGLDILKEIQENFPAQVTVSEVEWTKDLPVDDQLIRFAKEKGATIITNDYNLNKHASVTGVRVLNINDLANAIKSVLLPGEELNIRILKEGKESEQGIGYLTDGTMVVVENGLRFLGDAVDVTVTNILQTPAGRVIFARLKNYSYR